MEKYFIDYLKSNASKLTYEIKSTEVKDDTAVVTVYCKYVDAAPVLKATISEYISQAFAAIFSGKEISDEENSQMFADIIKEQTTNIEASYAEATIDISCVKVDDKWLIDSLDEDVANVITCNFIATFAEIASSFGGSTEDSTEPVIEPQIGSGVIGDYAVSIISYALSEDYNGNPAVIITFEWTNNSQETTSFTSTFYAQLFQNGIECDSAIMSGSDNYDPDNTWKDIKPGATLTVQEAYELQDTSNPVDVEISEFMTFDSSAMVIQSFEISQ